MWNSDASISRSISRRDLLAAFSALGLARSLRAQDSPTFQSGVKVVNIIATVQNGKGDIVRNLNKEDFTVEEDGRPQTITYFTRETDLPLTLGLLVDTSRSQRRVLPEEKRASYKFLEKVLRENKDQAFLIRFERDVELIKDLTGSRKDLEAALDSVDTPEFSRPGDSGSGSSNGGSSGGGSGNGPYGNGGGRSSRGGGGRGRGGTSLYDAVYLASDEVLKKQQGRKALIVLTDGVDNASKTTLTRAIETAQRSDTLVYSIYFADDEQPGSRGFGGFGGPGFGGGGRRGGGRGRAPQEPRPDGKKVLEQISRETGGAFFEISKKHTIDDVYAQIEDQLRNEYSLGYTPDASAGSGYRKLRVTAKGKGLVVQARDGYYPS